MVPYTLLIPHMWDEAGLLFGVKSIVAIGSLGTAFHTAVPSLPTFGNTSSQ